jgi:hypothetical protein
VTKPNWRPARIRLSVAATPIFSLLRHARLSEDAEALVPAIGNVSDRVPPGWPIGLEHKLLRRGFGDMRVPVAAVKSPLVKDIRFVSDPAQEQRTLLRRPPSEAAARTLWERAACGTLEMADLLNASALAGGGNHLRPGKISTSAFPSGHCLEFVAPEQLRPRFDRLLRRLNVTEPQFHPLLHAIAIYYETLLIHPLRDGNGRLARLLFQLSLRQTIGLKAPIFPLGPACAANRPALIAAYLAWEFDRDAQPLVDFLIAALTALLDLYQRTGTKPVAPPLPS